MRTIQRYLAVLLLILTATTAQAQKHRLRVISTVGSHAYVSFYPDNSNLLMVLESNSKYEYGWDGTAYGISMEAGDSIIVVASVGTGWKYTYMEIDGKKIHQKGDENYRIDGYELGSFLFFMPDHDVDIYIYAEYDPEVPELPGSPNGSTWNASTGELFISGFLPYIAEWSSRTIGTGPIPYYVATNEFKLKLEEVKKITIEGEVGEAHSSMNFNSSPWPNVETLDLRHTYGYLARNFSGNAYTKNALFFSIYGLPHLKKLILPSNIEIIWDPLGWDGTPLLEDFTLYAPIPPSVIDYYARKSFDKLPANCILYVPEQSVAAYKADTLWNKFADILPIPEGEAENITVDLPDNFTDGRYEGMSLSLFNARTGEQTKYIVDERPSYIFYAQTCDEPYTAQLMSPQGVLIASTDTVKLGNKPMEMTFKTVQPMHTVQLTVQTPAEQEGGAPTDVTDQTTIVWMDAMGNRIGTGNTIARQVEGTRLLYGITLPAELAAHYGVPPRIELVVKEATAQMTITLAQPDSIILSGKVIDTEGKPISMATVTASLMMNGIVGKVFTATTDMLGRYELTAVTGDLTLSATASGYVAARKAVTAIGEQTTIDPIQLAQLSGPTIAYNFTYTKSTAKDEEATPLPYYSDYANVIISAYNETTGEALDSLMVAYPEVQLLSGAKTGDRIRLTASSLKDAFMPVNVTVTLNSDEEKADSITFALKELGGVEVSFLRTDNQAVTAALYDADGLLCRQEVFDEATLTFEGLKDGNYTLITMGSDPLLSKLLYLSDYRAVGLTEGTDYISNRVKVESGVIAKVTNDQIPTLNAEPFYYTDDTKTLFMPNKTEVSTSCNVTLRAEIGFKEDIKERVSNVRLLVDYPSDKAEFVEGSSMTGNKMVRASVEDGILSIPVENDYIDEPVRFILTAIDQGKLMASAQVQFDIDGRTVTQPIGFATCEVKYMTIVAPESIYKLSFPVRGNAPALCPIRVYVGNDILVGETQSFADGSWDMHVELPECPNLSTIPVYAVITTKQGREAKTETVNVIYDKDMIRPLHVLMFPPLIGKWNNPKDFSSVISDAEKLCIDFDFENPMSLNEQWYSAYVHTSNPFLFEIIFNTTDSALVKNVVLKYTTVHGIVDYLKAEYDAITGHWMCSVNLQNDAVCNVDVGYLDETEPRIDADWLYLSSHMLDYIKEGFETTQKEMDRVLTGLGTETNPEKRQQLFQELAELMEIDLSSLGEEAETDRTLDEIFADMEAMNAETNDNLDGFLRGLDLYNMDLGENISFTHTEGLTPEQLLTEGYTAIKTTEGNTVYQLIGEDCYVFVDFQNDMRLETKGNSEAADLFIRARRGQDEDLFTKVNRENGWLLVMSATISALINEAKQFAQWAHKVFHANWMNEMKKETEFLAKYCTPNSPLLTDHQIKQLKRIQGDKQFQALCSDISNQLGNNGLDIHKAPIPVPITKTGIKLQSIMKTISAIGEVFSWITVLSDCKEGYDRINELESIYREIPNPCKDDESNARHLRNDVFNFIVNPFASGQIPYFHTLILSDILATETVGGGLKIATATGGTSMSTVLGGIVINLTKIAACWVMNETYAKKIDYYTGELRLLNCDEEYRKKQEKWWKASFRAENGDRFRNVRVAVDPSGYVYEAVADNRVENATATIYFKQTGEDEYGDLHDEVVKWNAAEFRQENPQLTDAEGKYAWDVPQGLWQVKIEKDGYETAYSDWLPVPPPQLDINIPLVRNTLPDVQTARAYEDGVEVTFNEYMRPQSLTTERLMLSQNGEQVPCRIEQQDRSRSYDKKEAYVSRVKVRTDKPLANGSKVQLTIRRQVEAYSGLQMQHDYQQEFTVVSEVYAIGTDSIIEVARDGERTITVYAFPAQAAAGMMVTAKSIIGTIATVTDEATFDANGEAHLTVKGKVGGQTALLLSLENSKLTTQSIIEVKDPRMLPVYAPTASHISGTYMQEGETVALSCETEGATIWYTTDGTCPCDENGTRQRYTAPISITNTVTIRAYAVKGDDASRVVSFTYGIYDPVGIHTTNADQEVPDIYYSPNGTQLRTPQKGVNIVKRKDGTIEKVLVK